MFSILALFCACMCVEMSIRREASFIGPFVDENGKSPVWRGHGDYLVKNYSAENFVQLGYQASSTSGAFMSERPIDSERFAVDFDLKIFKFHGSHKGGGMALWIADNEELKEGECYGRSPNFNGILVALDFSGKPFIGVKGGAVAFEAAKGKGRFDKVYYTDEVLGDIFKIRIYQDHTGTGVDLIDLSNKTRTIYTSKARVVRKSHRVGISASNAKDPLQYKLYAVGVFRLDEGSGPVFSPKSEHGGRYIWYLFALALAATGYYLYVLQSKKASK
jgi:lectin, mannose-binding 2